MNFIIRSAAIGLDRGCESPYTTSMTDILAEMLNERERQRDGLVAKLASLDAEIRVLREARDRMAGKPQQTVSRSAKSDSDGRALKPMWADVLRYIGSQDVATLDDIMKYVAENDLPIQRNTLRSQVSIYSGRGWLERVGSAQFRLTEAGAEKCGYVKNKESPAEAEPSEENGGGMVRDRGYPPVTPEGSSPSASIPDHRRRESLLAGTSLSSASETPKRSIFD